MPRSPARGTGSLLLLFVLFLLPLVLGPGVAQAAETQVYLSWGNPYGFLGARDTLVRACDDSTRVDTLCLSFEAGEDFPKLVAITGEVDFLPPAGDTLSGYWSLQSNSKGPGSCRGEFAGSGRAGCPFPWSSAGMPMVSFRRVKGRGVVRFLYAVSASAPEPVRAGERYCLARIMIRHRSEGGTGCRQPLRVVWSDAEFGQYPGGERQVISGRQRPVFLRTP